MRVLVLILLFAIGTVYLTQHAYTQECVSVERLEAISVKVSKDNNGLPYWSKGTTKDNRTYYWVFFAGERGGYLFHWATGECKATQEIHAADRFRLKMGEAAWAALHNTQSRQQRKGQ